MEIITELEASLPAAKRIDASLIESVEKIGKNADLKVERRGW